MKSHGAALAIKHTPLLTRAIRASSRNKFLPPVAIPSPYNFPVEGHPNSNLMRELAWYLESFLDYPFPPETIHADYVRA